MKQRALCFAVAVCSLAFLGTTAKGDGVDDLHDQNVTAIFGSGNPNTGWEVNYSNGLQLALRAKNRTTGATTNDGMGTYNMPVGTAPSSTRAAWNFEFSINSDVNANQLTLDNYSYKLYVDTDPSEGVNWIVIDPINMIFDNAYGNNSTPNGGGVEGDPTNAQFYNIAQNSENTTFAAFGAQDPNLDATYDFKLEAYNQAGTTLLGSVDMRVIVGEGGAAVPEPSSYALAFGGIGMLIAWQYFRRRRQIAFGG